MEEQDNRCTVPFNGCYVQLHKNLISPCCKVTYSPVENNSLINSNIIELRKSIKENKRHRFCQDCWKNESINALSHRIKYSLHFNNPIDWDKMDIYQTPKSVGMIFSNKCQMQCIYCNESVSSMWEQALNLEPLVEDYNSELAESILHDEKIELIMISGGEPMLEDRCVDFLMKMDHNPKRRLIITTNLSYGPATFNRLLKILDRHPNLCVECSIDAIGDNISRKYFNWKLWSSNFVSLVNIVQKRIPEYPDTYLSVKTAVGLFNYKDVQKIIEYILDFRLDGFKRITFDLSTVFNNSVGSIISGKIDNSVRINLDKKYLPLLSDRERRSIELINNFIKNAVVSPAAEERTIRFTKYL